MANKSKAKIKIGIEIDEAEAKKLENRVNKVARDVEKMQSSVTQATTAAEQSRARAAQVAQKAEQDRIKALEAAAEEEARIANERIARNKRIEENLAKARAAPPIQDTGPFQVDDEKLQKSLDLARQFGKEQEFMHTLWTKGEREATLELQKSLGIRQKSNALTKDEIKAINLRATELRHESIALRRAAVDLERFSAAAVIAGTAIFGGAFKLASDFAKDMKEVNATAFQFVAVQNQIRNTRNAIGESIAKELIPILQQANTVLDRASLFIKQHPEIVPIALKGAEILVGVGLVGKAVAGAARLTADFLAIQSSILRIIATRATETVNADKQVAAAGVQKAAADEQLEAAGLQEAVSTTAPVTKGALGGLAGAITSPIGSVALVTATVATMTKLSNTLDQLQPILNNLSGGLGDTLRTAITSFFQVIPGGQILGMIEQVKYISKAVQGIFGKITQQDRTGGRTATSPAGRVGVTEMQPGSVALSKNLDQLLEAYDKYITEDLQMVQDHYAKRKKITEDALEDERRENERNAKAIADINKDLQRSLTKLTRDYDRDVVKMERDHNEKRAKVIADQHDDILRMEEDLRNKLRKMERDHNEKVEDLLAARDALGLVKEQRRYLEDVAEARREANEDMARRKKDIADRLAEIDREYAEDKARRLEAYQERVMEEREQAAERLVENAERHKEEMKQIREQAAAKLAEEDRNFADERRRRYNQFIQRIRDLDAFYLGEINLERKRHETMIADLDAFLTSYRNKAKAMYDSVAPSTATGGTTGGRTATRAGGGYVGTGVYRAGEIGKEFVMSNATTRAAESLIGGQLSQSSLLAALSSGGKRTTIVWNDQRRFDSKLSLEDRRLITKDTVEVIERMIA